jgi:tetratricopeptide (TPR) repeat protein
MSLPDIAGHELQDLIGSGSCGAVYRAVSGGKPCAVKVFSSMAINRKVLAHTVQALQQMPPHRGVLPVEDSSFDRSPYFCAMPLVGVMTKDSQGRRMWQTPTLETACHQGLPADQAWSHIYQLADALAWLHKHGIPHGNLRPCNVLLEDDAESSIRLTDIGQGWVGGVHHVELSDHFVHLCPDQGDNGEGVYNGFGASWDVYAFGVISYRLLTGLLPRGAAAWAEQVDLARRKAASGLAYGIDSRALLTAVRAQPKVTWPSPPLSKWDERRRSIIERALDLNGAARWKDLREVVREFEVLESDYLLEEAREQTVQERKKQARRVRRLQIAGLSLLVFLILTSVYAFATLHRARGAEKTLADKDAAVQQELDSRDGQIRSLTAQRDTALKQKQVADANLEHAQNAVDQFLTQLLQTPAGTEAGAQFSTAQLNEALSFCLSSLAGVEHDQTLGEERLRAFGNIGQIYYRMRDLPKAVSYLQKARDEAAALIKAGANGKQAALYQQWLGRYSLLLSDIYSHRGDRDTSLALLKDATANLQEGLAANPKNRLARNECARAWMEYGRRTLEAGDLPEAERALGLVPRILDERLIGSELVADEKFLLARAKFAEGLAQRDAGRIQEALTTLIDSVQAMGQLVLGSSPRNQDQALLLADAYTELAELIGKTIGPKEAREAFNQAVPILLELNRLLPEWAEVKYLLARNYSGLALLERDAGKNAEAVKKKQDAIELLNEILADEQDNVRYGVLLARSRGEYAELMSDLGRPTNALPIVKQAVETMEALLAKDPKARLTPERRQWEIQLAQMYGILGHTSQALSKKDEAKAAFAQAAERWTKLAALTPGDEEIQQGLTWAKDRLAKLK